MGVQPQAGEAEAAIPGAAESLHHLLLQTRDLALSEAFYLGFLGFTVRKRDQLGDGRPLTSTDQGLGLTDGGPEEQGRVDHIAFRARGVGNIARRAREKGITILSEPGPGAYGHT